MRRTTALLTLVLATAGHARTAGPMDPALAARIREEGLKKGQAAQTLHRLVDGFGPRLTASPNYKAAAEWAVAQMRAWGLEAALEPWDFGHAGWTNEFCAVHALAPFRQPLHAEVMAWTPGTRGAVQGEAVRLDFPEEPMTGELEAALKALEGRVKGRVVLVGRPKAVPVLPSGNNFMGAGPRLDEAQLLKRLDPSQPPQPSRFGGDRGAPRRQGAMRANDVAARVDAFLVAERALARVNDAGMRNGLIRAFANRSFDLARAVPTVVLRAEDYGRIWRLMEDGQPARLELDVRNRVHPDLTKAYNIVGELKGATKPDEVVILGAHFDSWHTGTGTTDNGVNAVVMMEALRLLKAAGARPARTVRVVLYDAEEHGLLGSKAYVAAHYGTAEAPKAEWDRLALAFNMDSGAGQPRGFSVFGPAEAGNLLREAAAGLKDLGVVGALHNASRPVNGGTDSHSFSFAGLPVASVIQDGLEYMEYTWHTPIDTLERVPPEDTARAATILATVAFQVADREGPFPRYTKEGLPPVATAPAAATPPPAPAKKD